MSWVRDEISFPLMAVTKIEMLLSSSGVRFDWAAIVAVAASMTISVWIVYRFMDCLLISASLAELYAIEEPMITGLCNRTENCRDIIECFLGEKTQT
jgi:hypothetical protein